MDVGYLEIKECFSHSICVCLIQIQARQYSSGFVINVSLNFNKQVTHLLESNLVPHPKS